MLFAVTSMAIWWFLSPPMAVNMERSMGFPLSAGNRLLDLGDVGERDAVRADLEHRGAAVGRDGADRAAGCGAVVLRVGDALADQRDGAGEGLRRLHRRDAGRDLAELLDRAELGELAHHLRRVGRLHRILVLHL